ncbi:MAG: BRO family protein [Hyphomicrobiaceae bacterium]
MLPNERLAYSPMESPEKKEDCMSVDLTNLPKLRERFEDKRFTFDGVEAWSARDLQVLLGYDRWENFRVAIDRAMESCRRTKHDPKRHFVPVASKLSLSRDKIFRGIFRDATKNSGRGRPREEMILSRYACYLVAINGDPSKEEVAFAQAYFVVQTRKMEVLQEKVLEVERLHARQGLSRTEETFTGVLFEHGVDAEGCALIRNAGDKALFGGLSTAEMKRRLRCPRKVPLANRLQTVLIKGKDFATALTIHVTLDRNLHGRRPIGRKHVKHNRHVRQLLRKNGVTPEDLPPAEDTKTVAARRDREVKAIARGNLPSIEPG